MNHLWQLRGDARSERRHHFGYQDQELDTLDEEALVEAEGLGARQAPPGTIVPMLRRVLNSRPEVRDLLAPLPGLDWDGDRVIGTAAARMDINADGLMEKLFSQCDWSGLRYDGGNVIGVLPKTPWDAPRIQGEEPNLFQRRPAREMSALELRRLNQR
jgi:hypothetical protein